VQTPDRDGYKNNAQSFATQKGPAKMPDQNIEIIRAQVRGYGCEYSQGFITKTKKGGNWTDGRLRGTLTVKLEYVPGLRTIRATREAEEKRYSPDETPSVTDIQELMATLTAAHPMLEELDVRRVTSTYEENGKKWTTTHYDVSTKRPSSRMITLGELVKAHSIELESSFPDNTTETLTPPENKLRPGGKKARKAEAEAAALQAEEAKA
jgi:hypothetical protein